MDADSCPCDLLAIAYLAAPIEHSILLLCHTSFAFLLSLIDHVDVSLCPAQTQTFFISLGRFSHPWPPTLALFPSGDSWWSGEAPFMYGLPELV